MRICRKTWLRILLWLLVVLWMGIIFRFSAQKAEDSDRTSGEVVNWLVPSVDQGVLAMPAEEQPAYVANWTFMVRKSAHFILFTGMGVLAFAAFSVDLAARRAFPAALALGTGWAVLDEIHQLFVPGRVCEFRDICIDTAGVLLGAALLLLVLRLIRRRKAGA